MNKFKGNFFKDWMNVYLVLILIIYFAGIIYFNWHQKLYEQGKVAIESDGPMGAFLFVVIPFVVTVLFVLVALSYYHFQKRKFNKSDKNRDEL